MPSRLAFTGVIVRLAPVHRMIGSSGRIRHTSLASTSPVMPGMVWSVIRRSNAWGDSRRILKASVPLVQATTW